MVAIWRHSGGPGTPLVDPGTPYGATLKTSPADLTTAKPTTRLLSTMLGLWSRQRLSVTTDYVSQSGQFILSTLPCLNNNNLYNK